MTNIGAKMNKNNTPTSIKPELVEKDKQATYCLNCGDRTGYGFGKEPTRHDIHWFSSPCWQKYLGEK